MLFHLVLKGQELAHILKMTHIPQQFLNLGTVCEANPFYLPLCSAGSVFLYVVYFSPQSRSVGDQLRESR